MPSSDRLSRRLLIAIIASAFALRLFVALGAVPVLHADSDEYHHYAANLVQDHAYYFDYRGPIAAWRGLRFRSSRPPGYPFFIAAVYFFTGPHPRAVLIAQALLDTMTVLMIYLLALRLIRRKSTALLAAALYALISYRVGMLMSEILATALLTGLLLLLSDPSQLSSHRRTIGGGLIFGALILTRPLFIIFAPLIALWYWLQVGRPRGIRLLVIFGAVTAALITPWIVRDYSIHHHLVFLATVSGRTFHQGSYIPIDGHDIYLQARRQALDEVETDHLLFTVTFDYLKQHPTHEIKAMFTRIATLWTPFMEGGDENKYFFNPLINANSLIAKATLMTGYLAYFLSRAVSYLGLLGLILHRRRIRQFALIYAPPIWLSLFHFLSFLGLPRYLAPAYPVLAIASAMIFLSPPKSFSEYTSPPGLATPTEKS